MENEKMPVSGREIGIITTEINELWRQAQSMALTYAVEIGRRLVEAKSVLKFGEWGKWLSKNVSFSQSAANSFMQLFEEYGSSQITLFGAVSNSQTLGNLPYSKALALLAIPSEEREDFAKEVNADELSVRELKKVIAERDAALKDAARANAEKAELEKMAANAKAAQCAAEESAKSADELRTKVERLEKDLEKSSENARKLKDKLKRAESDPKLPPEMLQKLKDEARAEADGELESKVKKELEAAQKAAALAEEKRIAAEKEARAASERLAQAERQLKTANPEVTAFKTLFEQMQDSAKKLLVMIAKISAEDEKTANALRGAMRAFGESLGK